MQLDVRRQECEDLRQEIASLNARIKELLPHERMYRVAKARLRDTGAGMGVEVATGATDEVRRTPARSRRGRTHATLPTAPAGRIQFDESLRDREPGMPLAACITAVLLNCSAHACAQGGTGCRVSRARSPYIGSPLRTTQRRDWTSRGPAPAPAASGFGLSPDEVVAFGFQEIA